MTKSEFLLTLRDNLFGLPEEDIEKSIEYYSEIIDDRIEDGLSENEAVEAVGSVKEIASQILMETPLPKLIKTKVKPKRNLKVWEIVLLILGSPVWLSLLLTAVVIVLSIYITLWAVIISFYAAVLSLAVGGVAAVVNFAVHIIFGNPAQGTLYLGGGLFLLGLSILSFFGCNQITKGAVILGKKILIPIKALIAGKGKPQ